jgi:transcriptional regulator of acetoin/glycerol metabolism
VAVHGDEHFIALLHGLSCYGYPIIDPHTRRLGVLSITRLAGERNPLVAFLRQRGAEIEQRPRRAEARTNERCSQRCSASSEPRDRRPLRSAATFSGQCHAIELPTP